MFLFPASRVVEELKKLEENLTAADQLCVEIAALCHDLGKGQVKKTRQLSYQRLFLQATALTRISGSPSHLWPTLSPAGSMRKAA